MKIRFFVILSAILLISCSRESAVQFSHPFLEVENNNQSENWYDIPGMICRDGSPTGIGYRVGNPKKLAIYINGGGACFNPETCGPNPKSFNGTDMQDLYTQYGNSGIFNASNPKNPLKDFSFVFVPYCTGDVHSGTKDVGFATGVADTQRYVGSFNFIKAVDFIQPYFNYKEVEEVVLFGLSAGGYGVYVNFLEVFKRFPNAKITVINDSGPLFNDDQAFPICLQFGFSVIFGLPLPTDLVECCGTPDIGLSNVYEYSSKNFPKANYGFMSSYNDATSRFFLSFGYNNCSGAPGNQLPADVFKNALINLREDILKPKTTWSTFYINGDSHTMFISDDIVYEREVGGMYLYEWVDKLMKGQRMHVSE